MRNVFDQYDQPENKLTHALVMTLLHDRKLIRPFLDFLRIRDIPPINTLSIVEQQIPGSIQNDVEEDESKGLPDACVFNETGWAVLFECKIQAPVLLGQLQRHIKTAIRYGFESPNLVVIAVDEAKRLSEKNIKSITWKELYSWFSRRSSESFWAREFVKYMQIFEQKMLARDYDIRGTLTVFDGIRFDADNPYTYREGKRLIRLLGEQLQARKDLHKIGVDPTGGRRSAITGKGSEGVWDFLPLVAGRNAKQFTDYPHLTIALRKAHTIAAVTIPNGVKGGFRTKLKQFGFVGFNQLLTDLEKRLRPVIIRSKNAKPVIYVVQRHFRSQSSAGEIDARLDADLRTSISGNSDGVRYQPQWIYAIYEVLINKRSNLQFGIEVKFSNKCPIIQSAKAADLFADSWKAIEPLISFVTDS